MAFTLPTFNLTANVWHYGTWFGQFPLIIPPPDATIICNLALGRRVPASNVIDRMWLLCPAFTDIRDDEKGRGVYRGDMIEVPAGSGRFYFLVFSDDAGKGFANEHRWATLSTDIGIYPQIPLWPVPYP